MNKLHYPSLSNAPRDGDSPFVEAVAVDAWDAWFRWRDNGALRDLTVDSTWDRVATALASVESADTAATWKRRYGDAFAGWQLLLDERILATAGTGKNGWPGDGLVAVLNVAAFVRAPSTLLASFDQVVFEELAALAVRALDDASNLTGSLAPADSGLQIGIVGLADAFALLGLDYDSADACALAGLVAQTLAQGCRRESAQLERERGARIRHSRLTAINSQPRLALFANNVVDAADPFVRIPRPDHAPIVDNTASVIAQLNIRAAMQKWVDEPIDYPVLVDGDPGEPNSTRWSAAAAGLGLPPVRWRKSNLAMRAHAPVHLAS